MRERGGGGNRESTRELVEEREREEGDVARGRGERSTPRGASDSLGVVLGHERIVAPRQRAVNSTTDALSASTAFGRFARRVADAARPKGEPRPHHVRR